MQKRRAKQTRTDRYLGREIASLLQRLHREFSVRFKRNQYVKRSPESLNLQSKFADSVTKPISHQRIELRHAQGSQIPHGISMAPQLNPPRHPHNGACCQGRGRIPQVSKAREVHYSLRSVVGYYGLFVKTTLIRGDRLAERSFWWGQLEDINYDGQHDDVCRSLQRLRQSVSYFFCPI